MLPELQAEHKAWVMREFPQQPAVVPAAGLVEEAGELLHAILKLEEWKLFGADRRYCLPRLEADVVDAVGDCGIYFVSFCNAVGWDALRVGEACVWQYVGDRLQLAILLVKVASECNFQPYCSWKFSEYFSLLKRVARACGLDASECIESTWKSVKLRRRKDG